MKMKKFISILSVLALLMGLFTSCGRSDEERSKILKIYNWGDYIDEDVLTDFPKWYKEQTGEEVRIIYQVFDINEIMLTKIERGHEDFDHQFIETEKYDAKPTYKKFLGYRPGVAVIDDLIVGN